MLVQALKRLANLTHRCTIPIRAVIRSVAFKASLSVIAKSMLHISNCRPCLPETNEKTKFLRILLAY